MSLVSKVKSSKCKLESRKRRIQKKFLFSKSLPQTSHPSPNSWNEKNPSTEQILEKEKKQAEEDEFMLELAEILEEQFDEEIEQIIEEEEFDDKVEAILEEQRQIKNNSISQNFSEISHDKDSSKFSSKVQVCSQRHPKSDSSSIYEKPPFPS